MDIDDSEFDNTPPEITEKAENVTLELLPEISRKKYEMAYAKFMDWRGVSKVNSFSENVLLVYFEHLSTTLKASRIGSQYSMLRSTLSIKDNVDISKYPKLRSLLKRKSENYIPKKSKILSAEEIQKFINDGPDEKYLLTKGDDLLSFLYKYPISKLSQAEANQVEMLILTLTLEKPELRASNIFTVGTNLLSSISGNVVTYVLVALQFNATFSK